METCSYLGTGQGSGRNGVDGSGRGQHFVEVHLLALARPFAVAADEDDDGDDDGAADGGAGRDDDLVHVRRCLTLGADLAALVERHRLRRHVAVLQRHHAHHQALLSIHERRLRSDRITYSVVIVFR